MTPCFFTFYKYLTSEPFRERRTAFDQTAINPTAINPTMAAPVDDVHTSIIRRHPTGPIPQPLSDDLRTGILRREPSGPFTVAPDGSFAGADDATMVSLRRLERPQLDFAVDSAPDSTSAITAVALSILSGWATGVVATDLVSGWWATDRLFCVGVGFLTAVFAASTIAGVVAVLLRRRVGIFLTIVAAVLALLIFAGIFVADARTAGVVRALPVLPLASLLFVLLPATWRWTRS